MNLSLRDLLETDEFSNFKVISGHGGLDRPVTSVSVMDAPDIYEWMHGGEILITTGYIFRDDLNFLSILITKLHEAGAAALFVKLGRFFDTIPKEAAAVSDKLNFPLVQMPIEYAFTDVINPVLARIVDVQEKSIEYSNQIHKAFIDIAIKGYGIEEIIRALSHLLGQHIVYYDSYFKKLYQTETNFELEIFVENFREIYTSFPLEMDRKIYGFIVILKKDYKADEYGSIAIEHASTVIKLDVQKKISTHRIEQMYRDQFVQDILFQNFRNGEELKMRGAIYGWSFHGSYRTVLIDIDDFKSHFINSDATPGDNTYNSLGQQTLKTAIQFLKQLWPSMIYTLFSDMAAVIIHEPTGKSDVCAYLSDVFIKLQSYIRAIPPYSTLSIAVGNVKNDITAISGSYTEAKQALKLAYLYGERERIVFFEKLGIYKLLYQIQENAALESFAHQMLLPLIHYDKANKRNLFQTLETIVDCNWNLKETSRKLFIHYNTVKQRYHRIIEILDIDLESASNRVDVELAVKYIRLNQ